MYQEVTLAKYPRMHLMPPAVMVDHVLVAVFCHLAEFRHVSGQRASSCWDVFRDLRAFSQSQWSSSCGGQCAVSVEIEAEYEMTLEDKVLSLDEILSWCESEATQQSCFVEFWAASVHKSAQSSLIRAGRNICLALCDITLLSSRPQVSRFWNMSVNLM